MPSTNDEGSKSAQVYNKARLIISDLTDGAFSWSKLYMPGTVLSLRPTVSTYTIPRRFGHRQVLTTRILGSKNLTIRLPPTACEGTIRYVDQEILVRGHLKGELSNLHIRTDPNIEDWGCVIDHEWSAQMLWSDIVAGFEKIGMQVSCTDSAFWLRTKFYEHDPDQHSKDTSSMSPTKLSSRGKVRCIDVDWDEKSGTFNANIETDNPTRVHLSIDEGETVPRHLTEIDHGSSWDAEGIASRYQRVDDQDGSSDKARSIAASAMETLKRISDQNFYGDLAVSFSVSGIDSDQDNIIGMRGC
ncbi:hypothetical protein I302_103472 [Kwoniella bestiolae CBS 10118]|uniref:Uncharacterized protein n=1 Tax=Kwoniella bestiolae CBS 10118 TaxID=1296100 RepID=A0A1B9G8I7_9TREE|nr:hypothetical protein I302_02173 [Kwoniella bestiolae CBS 10118]OCF27332.1 hypothetical protein I302_02173 [Kwoniella bestiolae CBS 10118]